MSAVRKRARLCVLARRAAKPANLYVPAFEHTFTTLHRALLFDHRCSCSSNSSNSSRLAGWRRRAVRLLQSLQLPLLLPHRTKFITHARDSKPLEGVECRERDLLAVSIELLAARRATPKLFVVVVGTKLHITKAGLQCIRPHALI